MRVDGGCRCVPAQWQLGVHVNRRHLLATLRRPGAGSRRPRHDGPQAVKEEKPHSEKIYYVSIVGKSINRREAARGIIKTEFIPSTLAVICLTYHAVSCVISDLKGP